jgi:hypothetical protein
LAGSPKPSVFVGSSSESLSYAEAVQVNLEPDYAYVDVWKQGIFKIADYGLESLLEAVQSHDFAIFIFAADDVAIMRGKRYRIVRDNVVFELGLFMGFLGRKRVFVIQPVGSELHLPSDLRGWNIGRFDPGHKNKVASLGPACYQIREIMQKLGNFPAAAPIELSGLPPGTKIEEDAPGLRLRNFAGRSADVVCPADLAPQSSPAKKKDRPAKPAARPEANAPKGRAPKRHKSGVSGSSRSDRAGKHPANPPAKRRKRDAR